MALVPPVDKDGFSYAGDSLFREASGLNRHRRATIPELKAHFAGKDTQNRPAHWYEAQLLHYGLPPSKVKGTAHKRRKLLANFQSKGLVQRCSSREVLEAGLGESYDSRRPSHAYILSFNSLADPTAPVFDAVMAKGSLTVPAHIQKIEADLKKEWKKREREAKKVLKEPEDRGTKRKADQASTNFNVNVSVQVSSTGAVEVHAGQPSTKRPKVANSSSAATSTSKETATATAPTARAKKAPATKFEKVKLVPEPVKAADKKQAVKKSAQQARTPKARTSQASLGGPSGAFDDVPPPYSEVDPDYGPAVQSSPRRSIGLLNGRYDVDCPHMEEDFPEYRDDFGVIATLDGSKLWLKFDFGPLVGIMKVDRPYEPDGDEQGSVLFWRGDSAYEHQDINIDNVARAGDANRLHFLGGGHIRGTIAYDWHVIEFDAYRIPGQSMTSEISPSQARAEWARRG